MKGQLREELEVRFEREARLVASLSHPGIVSVIDAGSCDDGRPFFVMDLIDGTPLGTLVERSGPLPVPVACDILRQVCAALQHAHDHNITHRDVKPGNVIIQADADGRPRAKLIDFGFAKSRAEQERMAATQDMSLMGTIGYLAPERIRNPADDDIRGDVYSVGALGYFVLTGKELLPDIGNREDAKRQFAPPPGFIDDEAVAGIIMQAMAVSKTRRWASCAALDDALRRLAEARAASSRPALPP